MIVQFLPSLFCGLLLTGLSAQSQPLRLPMGTPVSLELITDLDPRDLEEGYVIDLQVRVNVVINGEVMVRTGAYAEGVIRELEHPRSFGRPGRMVIEATLMQAIDGQLVPLHGEAVAREGDGKRGAALGAPALIAGSGLLFSTPLTLPALGLGFFIKGRPARLSRGLVLHARVLHHTTVHVFSEKNTSTLGTADPTATLSNVTDQH